MELHNLNIDIKEHQSYGWINAYLLSLLRYQYKINKNFWQKINITEFCKTINVSRWTFSRNIKILKDKKILLCRARSNNQKDTEYAINPDYLNQLFKKINSVRKNSRAKQNSNIVANCTNNNVANCNTAFLDKPLQNQEVTKTQPCIINSYNKALLENKLSTKYITSTLLYVCGQNKNFATHTNQEKNDKLVSHKKLGDDMRTQEQEEKQRYADSVYLTEKQYNKLVERFGEDIANEAIERVSNYKMAKGRRYKSDYHAILNWGIQSALEARLRLKRIQQQEEYYRKFDKGFRDKQPMQQNPQTKPEEVKRVWFPDRPPMTYAEYVEEYTRRCQNGENPEAIIIKAKLEQAAAKNKTPEQQMLNEAIKDLASKFTNTNRKVE